MAATNLYMNWTGVSFTPGGGAAIPIAEVTDVKVGRTMQKKKWGADASRFAKLILTKDHERTVTITSGSINTLASVPVDTVGTLTAVLNDAKNGVSTGALTLTLINCLVCSNPFNGQHNTFGTGTLEFDAFSTDGTTDPLTITQA